MAPPLSSARHRLCLLIACICIVPSLIHDVVFVPHYSNRIHGGTSEPSATHGMGRRWRHDTQTRRPIVFKRNSGSSTLSLRHPLVQSWFAAVVATLSIFSLYAVSEVVKARFRLPMYAPPLAAVTLIFAAEASKAAQMGTILKWDSILERGRVTGISMGGAGACAVMISRLLGPTPLARAAAISASSLFMTLYPGAGFFPPVAAFSSLYIDHCISEGPFATLGWKFAFFPCVSATLFLLGATRLFAYGLAVPLRMIVSDEEKIAPVEENEIVYTMVDVFFTAAFVEFLKANKTFYTEIGMPSFTQKLPATVVKQMVQRMGQSVDELVASNVLISLATVSAARSHSSGGSVIPESLAAASFEATPPFSELTTGTVSL